MTQYGGTSKSGKYFRYYKCWNAIGKKNCKAKYIKRDTLDSIVVKALQETLTGKNLSIIVDEIYKQHNEKQTNENVVKLIEKEISQVKKSINNIVKAIEQGIITDTTKERLQELENSQCALQEKLIHERMKEQVVLEEKIIENYLQNAVSKEPEIMIDLLVEKVYVYSDYIELILHYTDEPIKTPIAYKNNERPEGTSLRGTLIFTNYILYNDYFFKKGRGKSIDRKCCETRKMLVHICILS